MKKQENYAPVSQPVFVNKEKTKMRQVVATLKKKPAVESRNSLKKENGEKIRD